MKVGNLKTVLAECDDKCEVHFSGDVDGEITEVKFGKTDDGRDTVHFIMTERQQMVVEVQVIHRLHFIATSKADAEHQAEEYELPKTYKEDSFDIIRVENEKGDEI